MLWEPRMADEITQRSRTGAELGQGGEAKAMCGIVLN